ncbi:MAG: hypothetical protein A3H49_08585 [Nitrospirae bacterium RIFCSPLOWO2_02_FULL_62_14]|nr:MAG: hypothetical protein A3H49_08585 [Nitrospirae bacterium RIFCSPLOWO2_02_FULL_62_14]
MVFATLTQTCLVVLANVIAFVFRFEAQVSPEYLRLMVQGLPLVAMVYIIGFWIFGIERGLWRYVGFHDLKLIVSAGLVSASASYLLLHSILGWSAYPRSVIIMTGLLSIVFLGGIRGCVRILREWVTVAGSGTTRVLIVGAGKTGEMLARDLTVNPRYRYEPVVFADDNPVKQQRTIHGIPVGGTIEEIPSLVRRFGVKELVVAIPSASPALMQRVLASSATCLVPIKTLPNTKQILDSPVSMRQVRPMSLEDLLQREPVQTDLRELHPLLEGKRIVVTGAGGSIGSELCRQVARYRPEVLALYERHENSLYALELELRDLFPQVKIQTIVGDVTDSGRVRTMMGAVSPNLIFHAAAHKHVPMMERNIAEAVRNNVVGTRIIADAALDARVDRVVLISTDKAVNPSSVMGATKRVAESIVQASNHRGLTRFMVVRFGNVLGSTGSVVPLFSEQIKRGGPVTVTHPEVKRYFMTIPESVQLILQATSRGQGGDVFVLDMGGQIRILDLARNMIILSGLVPDRDIKIVYTGLRPGEKLYEELYEHSEQVEPTSHEKIMRVVGRLPFGHEELTCHLLELEGMLSHSHPGKIIQKLTTLVPTYVPNVSEPVRNNR